MHSSMWMQAIVIISSLQFDVVGLRFHLVRTSGGKYIFVNLPTCLPTDNSPIHRPPLNPPQTLERDGSNRAVLALVGQDTL